jgi:hypothetical protein
MLQVGITHNPAVQAIQGHVDPGTDLSHLLSYSQDLV